MHTKLASVADYSLKKVLQFAIVYPKKTEKQDLQAEW
jgi:hypothetical protein